MLSSGQMPFVFAGMVMAAGAIFGYLLLRARQKRAFVMLALGHLLGIAWLFLTIRAAPPTEPGPASTAYIKLVFLFLLVAPSFGGLLLGGVVGWWRGPRKSVE